jgi:hypothetical protein
MRRVRLATGPGLSAFEYFDKLTASLWNQRNGSTGSSQGRRQLPRFAQYCVVHYASKFRFIPTNNADQEIL